MATAHKDATISRDELIGRASALLPALRERALQAEHERRVPAETVDDLRDAGLLRVGNPVAYGGYGHDYDAVFDVIMELARACPSTAWCYGVWQSHNWMVGNAPAATQDVFYEGGPDTMASTAVSIVRCELTAVEGGFRLSGRWNFSSGCDSASWFMLAARGADRPMLQMMLVPAAEVRIVDNWYVSGLRGTGSKDVEVEDVFVPDDRTMSLSEHHGWDLHQRPSYRLPLMTIWPYTLASPAVGAAQGAVDEFASRLKGKSGPGRTADSVALQLRLAESSAEVDAARLILLDDCRDLLARAARGEELSPRDQSRYRRNHAFVARLCVSAVGRLFEAAGGHALYEDHPLQRFHRDVNAMAHHTALYWDSVAEAYGRNLLGLPPAGGGF